MMSNRIHSHARGPHSVCIHTSSFATIRIHSRRTTFSDTSYLIHSPSFITLYIHFRHNSHSKRASFNINIIHRHSRSYKNCHIHVQLHSRYIHGGRWRLSATTTYTACLIQPYTHSVFIHLHSSRTAFIKYSIHNHTRRASFSARIAILQDTTQTAYVTIHVTFTRILLIASSSVLNLIQIHLNLSESV